MRLIELESYAAYFYPKPRSYYRYKKEKFQRMIYDHWAAQTILKELRDYSKEYWIEILEDLRITANDYCCMAKTEEAKNIFIALDDVSTDFLNYLL